MTNIPLQYYRNEIITTVDDKQTNEILRNTILATTTMYPTKDGKMDPSTELRARLALESCKKAAFLGIKLYIVDGGSDEGWRQEVRDTGAIIFNEDLKDIPGTHFMGRSRRQVLNEASETDYEMFTWFEPEKHPLLIHENGHSPLLYALAPIHESSADLIVPRRLDELASYPLQQRLEELTGNLTVTELLQGHLSSKGYTNPEEHAPYLDQWIGPRTMNREGLKKFLAYDGTIAGESHDRWESIFVPVWDAMLDPDMVVRGAPVDFVYPQAQRDLESGNPAFAKKRVDQLSALVSAAEKYIASREN